MTNFCVVYITHSDKSAAEKLGDMLMTERLIACYNLVSDVSTACFWPPQSNKFERSQEVILLCKTKLTNFKKIEAFVESNHSYDIPCIFALPMANMSKKYGEWLDRELA